MSVLRPNVPPPPHYYADNLCRLLGTVAGQYSDILDATESAHLTRVLGLGADAMRLFARLSTRRGLLFRADALEYREVADTPAAIAELAAAELIDVNPAIPADRMLARLTLNDLSDAFPLAPRRGLRKETLIATVAARYPEAVLRARLSGRWCWLLVRDPDWLVSMRLLFFGGLRQDFSTFVLEDLGMVRHENYPLDRQHRLFATRDELQRYLELQGLNREIRGLAEAWHASIAGQIVERLWRTESNRLLERQRGRLLNALGREAERHATFDVALSAYARTDREPGRERRVRILERLGDRAGAKRLLDAIARSPRSAGERHFGEQFAGRIGHAPRRRRSVPEQRLTLAEAPASVEAAALEIWLRNGGRGAHLENRFSLGLLGLAFWDVVFSPVPGMFTHAHQDAPLDLYWADFRATRRDAIERRLRELARPGAMAHRLRSTYRDKQGVSNALVGWSAFPPWLLDAALCSVPATHLTSMFDFMLDDLEQTRTGFPDLVMCYGPRGYRLVEVKGPGDQLRREQRLWFELFDRVGMPALVLRVTW